jgi:hypothetical protein
VPQVRAEVWVPLPPAEAFAVSQTHGEIRLRWDPFIRAQCFLDDAREPAVGVRTLTKARVGPSMVSRYVAFNPPTSVGMTMVRGPWFFASFGGGWRFTPEDTPAGAGTLAVWKYTYAIRPAWLAPVAERVGQRLLGREIRRRIDAFARACADPVVLAAIRG